MGSEVKGSSEVSKTQGLLKVSRYDPEKRVIYIADREVKVGKELPLLRRLIALGI